MSTLDLPTSNLACGEKQTGYVNPLFGYEVCKNITLWHEGRLPSDRYFWYIGNVPKMENLAHIRVNELSNL